MQTATGQLQTIHWRRAEACDAALLAEMEQLCFPEAPWSLANMAAELSGLNDTYYLIGTLPAAEALSAAEALPAGPLSASGEPVVAYGGFWLVMDEAQITNVAVHPAYRRRGYGKALLTRLLEEAERAGAQSEVLEVRRSNEPAKALYRAMGFCEMGVRRGYYADNHEDALVYCRTGWDEPGR